MRGAPNFQLREFRSRSGARMPLRARQSVRRLCRQVLQPMRDEFGACRVNSGHRTFHENQLVGGARFSRHLYDTFPSEVGADVTFARGTPDQWAARARQLLGQVGGVGRYPGHVHVDLRASRADF